MTLTGFHEERHYTKAELSCLNDFDIHELLRKNILIGVEGSKYKFGFVGVVSNTVSAFCVLPKIWINTPIIPSQIDDTIASLNQYKKSNRIKHIGIDYFKTDPADPECSELAIAKFLINDYKKHGIYVVNEAITELNGNGDIDWPLTIGNLDPIYSQGQPIYSDTINHVIIDDREHLTVEIHKWSIAYVAEKYAHLLNEGNLLQTNVILPIETLGPKKQLIKHLIKELNITYTDRGIRLLKSLIFPLILWLLAKKGNKVRRITRITK